MSIGSMTNRQSIFAIKPTHMRIKTQTDCYKQNFRTEQQILMKRPLRRQNISQFDLKFFQKSGSIANLQKRTLAQRSKFGLINLHMPKFQKRNLTKINFDHPLKQYINSVNTKSLKRGNQNHKTSYNPLNDPSKQLQNAYKFLRQSYRQQVVLINCSKQLSNLHKLIDQIFKKLYKFKQVGYTDKKINQWIKKYCLNKRKYMTLLLMKSNNKHKFSETKQDYLYQKDPQKVKQKLLTVRKRINGKQMPIDQYDLIEFGDFIQDILIQKNRQKINSIKNSITQKLGECFIYNRQRNENQFGKKLYPPDMLNFVSDMNQLQARNGRFNNISTFNREYFNDLGSTQKDIRQKIYQLITITEKKNKNPQQKDIITRFTFDFQENQLKNQQIASNFNVISVNNIQQLQ